VAKLELQKYKSKGPASARSHAPVEDGAAS
jgi:hypothetical protein